MSRFRSAMAIGVRWRYALLAVWSLPWLIAGQEHRYPHGDWGWVELGARVLVHHNAPPSSGLPLHLYANIPSVQMGPPSLLLAAPFQWLSPQVEGHLVAGLMSLAVLLALWCAERAAQASGEADAVRAKTLVAGLVVVPIWTMAAQQWGHLDDVTALLAAMVAAVSVSRGRHEVLAGLILGTGAAAKPWAVILLPLLFAYSRPQVPRAVLAFVAGALIWWAPFVMAAPQTIHALGSVSLNMVIDPTWRLFGMRGAAPLWIRPVQLLGGLAVSTFAVRRVGWASVPVVALAWRVTTDPYAWPYYVMGPLLGAALWDLARTSTRRWASFPWATAAAAVAEFWVPRDFPAAAPSVRLAWCVGLVLVVTTAGAIARQDCSGRDQAGASSTRRTAAEAPPSGEPTLA